MNVDPVDDCTFWYVNEYYTAAGQASPPGRLADPDRELQAARLLDRGLRLSPARWLRHRAEPNSAPDAAVAARLAPRISCCRGGVAQW